jgi:hypothetical protein
MLPPWSAELVLPAAEFGPAELCSAAPPDVSALPDGGTVACFAASDDTPGPVGSLPESSAASAGARPSNNATAVDAKTELNMLPCVYPWSINVVVYHDPSGKSHLGRGQFSRGEAQKADDSIQNHFSLTANTFSI